jgi:hypothetical protein
MRFAAFPAGQHRAKRLRHARGLGIFRHTMNMVAAGPAGRVQLLDQLPDACEAAGIVGAHQHAVRARIGHDRHALLGIDRTGAGRARIGQQAVEQRHDVERRRVAQRHEDRLRAGRLVERRDDPVDPPQVVGEAPPTNDPFHPQAPDSYNTMSNPAGNSAGN